MSASDLWVSAADTNCRAIALYSIAGVSSIGVEKLMVDLGRDGQTEHKMGIA